MTEISRKQTILYRNLEVGSIFMLPNDKKNFYLTTYDVDFAIRLADGEAIGIDPDDEVIFVEAEFQIISIGKTPKKIIDRY